MMTSDSVHIPKNYYYLILYKTIEEVLFKEFYLSSSASKRTSFEKDGINTLESLLLSQSSLLSSLSLVCARERGSFC